MFSVKLILIFFIFLNGCVNTNEKEIKIADPENSLSDSDNDRNFKDKKLIDPSGNEICTRILTPNGYSRIRTETGTFGYYLSHFPLKKDGSKVYCYDGSEKLRADVYAAVLDIDAGSKDLQQCADAIIRLRAEYLYAEKYYDKIHFNFTNGFFADYGKWADGYRIKVSENNANWFLSGEKDHSYKTFRDYLEIVFTYAGTISLSKELRSIPEEEINPGDIFVRGGSPGHAVIVADVAVNEKNKKIFLLAQSYMPAQDIHILKNPVIKDISPWYDLNNSDKLYTPEWTFEKTDLKRFEN